MSGKALDWIELVAGQFGTELEPGRVRIPHSQAALAGATGVVEGTVTYYMRHLKPEVVTSVGGGLVVDIAALAERRRERESRQRRTVVKNEILNRWGQMTSDGSTVQIADEGKPPTVRAMADTVGVSAGTMQRHLRSLEASGQLRRSLDGVEVSAGNDTLPPLSSNADELLSIVKTLTAVTEQLTALATALLSRELDGPRNFADNPAKKCAQPAKFAESEEEFSTELPKKESKILSFSTPEDPRRSARSPRSSRDSDSSRLPDELIDEVVGPLERLCEQSAGVAITRLDARGRDVLGRLTEEQLRVGTANASRRLKAGKANSPLGLLFAKADKGDMSFFTRNEVQRPASPPLSTEPESGDVDLVAAEAIKRMSQAELQELDDAIAKKFSSEAFARIRIAPHRLAGLRRAVWRERLEAATQKEMHEND